MNGLNVFVVAWSERSAVVIVNQTRVRVDRMRDRIRWRCDEHGESTNTPDLCWHTRTVADTPAPENKKVPARRRANHPNNQRKARP